MCLILFSFQPGKERPLVLAANRDEFFQRPTAPAHFWEDAPQLLAGRDLYAGGTWLGITQGGRFAAITNIREPGVVVANPLSRGELTHQFLMGEQTPKTYLQAVAKRAQSYSGFNLLVGDFSNDSEQLYWFNNRQQEIVAMDSGVYGLSNAQLDTPWPKVSDGKRQLQMLVSAPQTQLHSQLRQVLENPSCATDERLPETGVGYTREKALSASFITLPDYGTRATTVITIDQGRVKFSEQNYKPALASNPQTMGSLAEFEWQIGAINPQPASAASR